MPLAEIRRAIGLTQSEIAAQLDQDMGRKAGAGVAGSDVLLGKFSFLSRYKVNGLLLEHEGQFCDRLFANCLPDKDVTSKGLTSKFVRSIPDIDFIKTRVEDGADVEAVLIWGGNKATNPPRAPSGHCFRILGYAVTEGVPSIFFQHDQKQGQVGGVSDDDGGYGWTCLSTVKADDGNTYPTMPKFVDGKTLIITNVLSEKVQK